MVSFIHSVLGPLVASLQESTVVSLSARFGNVLSNYTARFFTVRESDGFPLEEFLPVIISSDYQRQTHVKNTPSYSFKVPIQETRSKYL